MTQDEIMRMASEAGLQPYYDEQVTAIARFAAIVAATEREKCTNTQEFVTLPREVVERAIEALFCTDSEEGSTAYENELEAVKKLRAALEHQQNHVPDAGNMVPAGWKLVPVEPTEKMVDMGRGLSSFPNGVYRAMLSAAPQPPTTEQSSAVEQPQVEQEPVAKVVLTEQLGLPCLQWLDLDRQFDFKGGELLYTHPQPRREPLTNEQVKAGLIQSIEYTDARERCAFNIGVRFAERAHGIK